MSTDPDLLVAGIPVEVVRKNIKHLHLAVYPPNGHVRVSAPTAMPLEAVRTAVVTRLPWVRRQQSRIADTPRQSPREMVAGETHYFLGTRYRLKIEHHNGPTRVTTRGKATLVLTTRPDSTPENRRKALDSWYRHQLTTLVPPLLTEWSTRMGVEEVAWRMRHMRTRWATINVPAKIITINPEIAKQSPEALEYLLVHELAHLTEPRHGRGFTTLMDKHLPGWRERDHRLNTSVLAHEDWKY